MCARDFDEKYFQVARWLGMSHQVLSPHVEGYKTIHGCPLPLLHHLSARFVSAQLECEYVSYFKKRATFFNTFALVIPLVSS